jgi:hypothetical protein
MVTKVSSAAHPIQLTESYCDAASEIDAAISGEPSVDLTEEQWGHFASQIYGHDRESQIEAIHLASILTSEDKAFLQAHNLTLSKIRKGEFGGDSVFQTDIYQRFERWNNCLGLTWWWA